MTGCCRCSPTVFVIAVVSGVQYVWIWSAKARRERVAARLKSR